MNFTKIFFSTILLSFFFFAGHVNAQLTVTSEGNVAIGTSSSSAYKLYVSNSLENTSARLSNTFSTTSTKYGLNNYTGSQGTGTKYGIYSTTYQNSGSASNAYGVYGYVYGNGTGDAYGLRTSVSGGSSVTRYGVYSTINGGTGYAGYFIGDVLVDGAFTINLMPSAPTQKLASVQGAAAKIADLNAVSYQDKRTKYTLDIASLKNAFPELVFESEHPVTEADIAEGEMPAEVEGKKAMKKVTSVDYNGLIPVLVQAIKEQQEKINELEATINGLNK